MNARSIILALAAAAVVFLLSKSLQTQPQAGAAASVEPSPVASLVEETLHQHAGEQSAFVEAFDRALHPGGAQSG